MYLWLSGAGGSLWEGAEHQSSSLQGAVQVNAARPRPQVPGFIPPDSHIIHSTALTASSRPVARV